MEYNMEWAQNINDSVEQLESDVSSTQKATRQNRLVITGIGVVCGVTALMLRAAMSGITTLSDNLRSFNGYVMSLQEEMSAVRKIIQAYQPDEQAPARAEEVSAIRENIQAYRPSEDLTVENVDSQA